MNNYIIRTRKFSKLKIPYLKIISLSNKKDLKNKKVIKAKEINNNNLSKKIVPFDYKSSNKESFYEKEIKNKFEEKLKLKFQSILSNNDHTINTKYSTPKNGKKIKIMKDNETNTDPIIEEKNLFLNDKNINISNNLNEDKNEKSTKNKISKNDSLKKNIKLSPNNLRLSDNKNENKNKKNEENDCLFNDKKYIISSFSKDTFSNAKDEGNEVNYNSINKKNENNICINNNSLKTKEKNNIIKININNINYSNTMGKFINNQINLKQFYDDSFNNKKNLIKKNRIKNRNTLAALNFSKSKDIENKKFSPKFFFNLLNNKSFYNEKIINNNSNSQRNISPLIKIKGIIDHKQNVNLSNRIYSVRTKNIKFSPYRENLFNTPVIENNNSLEETIKQQTVSNFNNKYNFKFKTKNPREKEKIKNLVDLLKSSKASNLKKISDLKNNYSKNKYKFFFEDNKESEKPKTRNIKLVKINKYFTNKKLENYLNRKTNNMISIKTINFLEGTF